MIILYHIRGTSVNGLSLLSLKKPKMSPASCKTCPKEGGGTRILKKFFRKFQKPLDILRILWYHIWRNAKKAFQLFKEVNKFAEHQIR